MISRKFSALLFAGSMMVSGQPASAASDQLAIIGIDISASAPITIDHGVAAGAAAYLERYVRGLDAGTRLYVLSVGDAGIAARAINLKATLGRRTQDRPEIIARQLSNYVQSLPDLIASGRLEAQGSTSLVDFLEGFEAQDCEVTPTRIILFTDGVESSSRVSDRAMVAGKMALPHPAGPYLTGCTVEMRGVGQLRSGAGSEGLYARLKPLWQAYFKAAGASKAVISREIGSF